jgi:nucleotide-binding universal stress UspA family protein
MGKIYVPVTSPLETKRAISKAVFIAREFNLETVIINIIDSDAINKLRRFRILIEEEAAMFEADIKRDAEKYIRYAENLGNRRRVKISSVLLEGDPYSEIYNYLIGTERGLVCIGRKREAKTLRDSFGNVERKLILNTNFDIIIAGGDE